MGAHSERKTAQAEDMVSADGNIGLTRVEQLTALISTPTKG